MKAIQIVRLLLFIQAVYLASELPAKGQWAPQNPPPAAPYYNPNYNPNLYAPPSGPQPNQSSPQPQFGTKSNYRQLIQKSHNLIASKQYDYALELLTEATRINSRDPELFFWRGLALDEKKEHKEAVKNYAESLKLAKMAGMDSSELRINLGNTLSKLGYFKEALYDYQRAVEITPTSGLPHLYLGRAYLTKEDYNLALDQFRQCEDLSFHDPHLPFLKSVCLAGLKRYEDARVELRPLLTDLAKTNTPELFKLASTLMNSLADL